MQRTEKPSPVNDLRVLAAASCPLVVMVRSLKGWMRAGLHCQAVLNSSVTTQSDVLTEVKCDIRYVSEC